MRQGYIPFISGPMTDKRAAPCDIRGTLQKQNYLVYIISQAAFCRALSDGSVVHGESRPCSFTLWGS